MKRGGVEKGRAEGEAKILIRLMGDAFAFCPRFALADVESPYFFDREKRILFRRS